MNAKRVAEFGLAFLLSAASLLVIAVPKVHAASYDLNSKSLQDILISLANNPVITMIATVVASSTLLYIARHYNRVNAKR